MNKYSSFPRQLLSGFDRPGTVLLQSSRFDGDNKLSYLFLDPRELLVAHSQTEAIRVLEAAQNAVRQGLWVAGYLSYECGALGESPSDTTAPTPLIWFGVYDKPYKFDHEEASFNVHPPVLATDRPAADDVFEVTNLRIAISAEEHAERVRRIHEYIRAGDTYQINLTTKFKFDFSGSATALFHALHQQQRVAYGAFIYDGERRVLSLSPELFFRIEDDRIVTRPMKGTARRGRNDAEDSEVALWLANDLKNTSENIMIVDLLRNDLGRVCEYGSVAVERLFEVEKYETVFQLTSTVTGKLAPGTRRVDILKHLFPCGSVTGAPKLRTMEIIRELESEPRGIYTGAIGFIAPNGDATFNVAIRTIVLEQNRGEMGVGGGIVIDSDPAAEYAECKLKAEFLTRRRPEFELIETLLWDDGFVMLQHHLERLEASAHYFDFAFDARLINDSLSSAVTKLTRSKRYKVRLVLSRSGAIDIAQEELGADCETPLVTFATERTDSRDPFLAHKTTNRTLYDRELQKAIAAGFDEVLFFNERDELTEGAISNVFVVIDGKWVTPPLECGVLPGIYRRHVLDTNRRARERVVTRQDLRKADLIYLCNSVRGMRPACLKMPEEAPITRKATGRKI